MVCYTVRVTEDWDLLRYYSTSYMYMYMYLIILSLRDAPEYCWDMLNEKKYGSKYMYI